MNDSNVYKPPTVELITAFEKPPLNAVATVMLVPITLPVIVSGYNTAKAFEFVNIGK